jgi:hypothetical protein
VNGVTKCKPAVSAAISSGRSDGQAERQTCELKAATDFMLHSRTAKEMHDGDAAGTVVFAFSDDGHRERS